MTVHAVLMTADLQRLVDYYTGLFGAQEAERVPPEGPPFYVGLRIGEGQLGIVADDTGVAPDARQRCLLSVEVDDVDRMLGLVAELGGTVTGGPNDMPWGQRVAHTSDPDGNSVNIAQPIG